MHWLRYNTASQEIPIGYMLDSTDGNTEETALTIANTDIKLWKTGATTLANKNSGGATHISNGIYYAVLDATDTNTVGPLTAFVHVSGALAVKVDCLVLPTAVYDALVAGTGTMAANVTQWGGSSAPALVSGRVDASVGAMATDVLTSGALATTAVDEIRDGVWAKAMTELSAVPAVTASVLDAMRWLFVLGRNKLTQTATTSTLRNDADSASISTSTVSDDGTTFTRGEWS